MRDGYCFDMVRTPLVSLCPTQGRGTKPAFRSRWRRACLYASPCQRASKRAFTPPPIAVRSLDKLAYRRRLGRPGKTRRIAVLAPEHCVLTAGVVGPLKTFEGRLEIRQGVGAGLEALGLDAPYEPLHALHQVAAGGADGSRAHRHD